VLVTIVSAAVLAVGYHWLTDVIGGLAVGALLIAALSGSAGLAQPTAGRVPAQHDAARQAPRRPARPRVPPQLPAQDDPDNQR